VLSLLVRQMTHVFSSSPATSVSMSFRSGWAVIRRRFGAGRSSSLEVDVGSGSCRGRVRDLAAAAVVVVVVAVVVVVVAVDVVAVIVGVGLEAGAGIAVGVGLEEDVVVVLPGLVAMTAAASAGGERDANLDATERSLSRPRIAIRRPTYSRWYSVTGGPFVTVPCAGAKRVWVPVGWSLLLASQGCACKRAWCCVRECSC